MGTSVDDTLPTYEIGVMDRPHRDTLRRSTRRGEASAKDQHPPTIGRPKTTCCRACHKSIPFSDDNLFTRFFSSVPLLPLHCVGRRHVLFSRSAPSCCCNDIVFCLGDILSFFGTTRDTTNSSARDGRVGTATEYSALRTALFQSRIQHHVDHAGGYQNEPSQCS